MLTNAEVNELILKYIDESKSKLYTFKDKLFDLYH